MALEPNFDFLDSLNPDNPDPEDPVGEGDDHLRGVKNALLANIRGDGVATRVRGGGFDRLFTANESTLHNASTLDVQVLLGVFNQIAGAAVFGPATGATAGGIRLLSSAGVPGPVLIEGESDAVVRWRAVGAVLGAVSAGEAGLGIQINAGEAAELVALDDAGAATLAGLLIESLALNSAAAVRDAAGDKRPVGFNALATREVAGSTTLDENDNGDRVNVTSAGAATLTIAAGQADGSCMVVTNTGAGAVTITSSETITQYPDLAVGDLELGQGAVITLNRRGGGWDAWGSFA